MKKQVALSLAIIVLIIVAAGVSFVLMYNGLVKAEKGVEGAKAQVETAYQRRLDLIPNLVETVTAYAAHERQTFAAITEARGKAQGVLEGIATETSLNKEQMAKLTASQSELTGVLKTLFALVENYPDLRASANFLTLQDQLEGTENRISVARQRYNSAVRLYNTKVATFPRNLVASAFGFQQRDIYFEAADEAEKAVDVEF
jgi:LemA protein